MEYGEAGAYALDVEPLEAAVDEARRMVCALGAEIKRRMAVDVVVWQQSIETMTPLSARLVSAGV